MVWGEKKRKEKKWSGSRWLWEKEKWWTSVRQVTLKDSFHSLWSTRLGSQRDLSGCKFSHLFLSRSLLASGQAPCLPKLQFTLGPELESGQLAEAQCVSLFPFWEQERCCGEESGPNHSGKVTADGGKAGLSQQADCQGRSEPYSRQLPSALEKEARQAGRAGGALSEAEGGKDSTARHRQALSWLSMPAWVVTKVLGSWHFSLSGFMGDYLSEILKS